MLALFNLPSHISRSVHELRRRHMPGLHATAAIRGTACLKHFRYVKQVLTIMEKRGTRQTRRAASAAAGKGSSAPGGGNSAAAGVSPELESVAEAASAAAAEPAT